MADKTAVRPGIRRSGRTRAGVVVEEEWRGNALPALVSARVPGLDLASWIEREREQAETLARRAGAVLFRGFAVENPDDFRGVMDALSPEVLGYGERSSPRTQVSTGVYTSTEHPQDQPIVLHNEQSYTRDWPLRIVFCCDVAPQEGGRTPLADSRAVLAGLSASTVEKFERLGVRYVRNYLPGVSLPWQEAFQTGSRAEVEAYCRSAGIDFEWIGADQLRTRQVRPAVHTHPVTGERSWFNHALFFHVTSLPEQVAEDLRAAVAEEDLPYQTYYGNGEAIEEETTAELRAVYAAETTSFEWRRGDVLVVENMLTAHGREPFRGPRRILAAMSDPVSTAGRTA